MAPTREIAVQIQEVMHGIGGSIKGLKCHTFIGGLPLQQDKLLAKSCHIAVGTPGFFVVVVFFLLIKIAWSIFCSSICCTFKSPVNLNRPIQDVSFGIQMLAHRQCRYIAKQGFCAEKHECYFIFFFCTKFSSAFSFVCPTF